MVFGNEINIAISQTCDGLQYWKLQEIKYSLLQGDDYQDEWSPGFS